MRACVGTYFSSTFFTLKARYRCRIFLVAFCLYWCLHVPIMSHILPIIGRCRCLRHLACLPTYFFVFRSIITSFADPDPGSGAFWPLDPESGIGKKSGSGSGIRDEQPGSYFLELRNHFFGLKYLNSLIPGSGMEKNSDSGSGIEKSRIRDREKHPGSATLIITGGCEWRYSLRASSSFFIS